MARDNTTPSGGQIDRLSSVEGMASTATDVVFATAKLPAGTELEVEERAALERARDLLSGVADFGSGPRAEGHLMLSGGSALDAIETVRKRAPNGDPNDWARSLAAAIQRGLDDELTEGDFERLAELRDLFASLAKLAVARANGQLAQRGSSHRWTGLSTTSTF